VRYLKGEKNTYKTINIITIIYIFLLLSTTTFFVATVVDLDFNNVTESNLDHLVILDVMLICCILLFCISNKGLKRRFALFSFTITFFVLGLGGYTTNLFNGNYYGTYVFQQVSRISYSNEAKGLMYMFLALVVVFVSYSLQRQRKRNSMNLNKKGCYEVSTARIYTIRKICRWTMYFGGIFAFLKVGSQAVFSVMHGYISIYTVTNAFYLNPVIDMFDGLYMIGFFGYLATFPNIKQLKRPLFVFFVYIFLHLIIGTRGTLVVYFLFIIWYLMKRDMLKLQAKEIITRGRLIVIIILTLFAINFLYQYGYTRFGLQPDTYAIGKQILRFVETQGGSGHLVSLGLENKKYINDFIPDWRIIFSPIYNFTMNNSLVRIFTGGIHGQSLNSLQTIGSFGSVLTYVTNPAAYLNGSGLGTSYIAELAVGGGVFGTILFNIFLGVLLYKLDNVNLDKWHKNTLLFNAYSILIYLPRQSALGIIPQMFLIFIFVFVINKITRIRLPRKIGFA
jgi:hypothetical protein